MAAFLNHTDTKAANALDMYDPQARYVTHYLIDFSSTLGADNADPQLPRFGNEYFLDFATIGRSMAGPRRPESRVSLSRMPVVSGRKPLRNDVRDGLQTGYWQ